MSGIWKHKSTENLYKVISENARMKDPSTSKWLDCVIYTPLYENSYEMFSRWSHSFYNEFEKKENIIELRFFKDKDKWYADVPNHTLEENEMIFGSDDILSLLAEDKNEVTLLISDSPFKDYSMHFQMKEHDDDGAYYKIHGSENEDDTIWICNVTHDVFGEHPEDIYLLKIERG